MKRKLLGFCMVLLLAASSCKDKAKETTTTTNDPAVNTTAPVQVNSDDALRTGVRDATKDFPTVNTSVENGVITVTGSINRADWARLMPALQALNPKSVDSKGLTIK